MKLSLEEFECVIKQHPGTFLDEHPDFVKDFYNRSYLKGKLLFIDGDLRWSLIYEEIDRKQRLRLLQEALDL